MTVTVFGAYGHTGRFVVAELRRRGLNAVAAGRDGAKLKTELPDLDVRVADVGDASSLDAALAGSRAVINCAGPFADTSVPLVEAAIRAGAAYLDVAAEQGAVLALFERFASAPIAILPAMAFYGTLGDLAATAAMGDWDSADEITVAAALDSWQPTRGTRLTGERNHGPRLVFANGQLVPLDVAPRRWHFPEPFGEQDVMPLGLAETITISRHLAVRDVRAYLNSAPLQELRNPNTPPPPRDGSAQLFVLDVAVRRGSDERRLAVRGRDIYGITAPIVVEATARVLRGEVTKRGAIAAGAAFDARDFLTSLPVEQV